jgi:hypothetical protein
MCTSTGRGSGFAELAHDPLVRLVMASDGVTEAEFVAVLQTAQRAVRARSAVVHGDAAARRPRRGLRAVPANACACAWM